MPIKEITEYMNSMDSLSQVNMLLAIHCAPLLHGIKLSNLVKLTKEQSQELCKHISKSGLAIWFLIYEGDCNQVLLFRRDEMQIFLNRKDIQAVLRRFGYTDFSLTAVMMTLSAHMRACRKGEQDFPDELGILLGYPVNDVLAYMENHGENYQYCGYWKVYHNLDQAMKMFDLYNRVRDTAVSRVLHGAGYLKREGMA